MLRLPLASLFIFVTGSAVAQSLPPEPLCARMQIWDGWEANGHVLMHFYRHNSQYASPGKTATLQLAADAEFWHATIKNASDGNNCEYRGTFYGDTFAGLQWCVSGGPYTISGNCHD